MQRWYLFIHPSSYKFIHPSIYLSTHLSIHLFIHPFIIHPSINSFIRPSILSFHDFNFKELVFCSLQIIWLFRIIYRGPLCTSVFQCSLFVLTLSKFPFCFIYLIIHSSNHQHNFQFNYSPVFHPIISQSILVYELI